MCVVIDGSVSFQSCSCVTEKSGFMCKYIETLGGCGDKRVFVKTVLLSLCVKKSSVLFGIQITTHTQPFNGLWSGTTRVGQYQKKHSHPS